MQPQQPHQAPQHPPSNYDFIINPAQPPRHRFFGANNSMASRALLVTGGLFVLLILFVIAKNFLGSTNDTLPALVGIAQDQQELIHLSANAEQNASSITAKNFAYTAQLSLKSEQQQLLAYLKNNGRKVSVKELNLKVGQATDDQLSSALSASTYDSTFKEIVGNKLTSYEQALKQAYALEKGPKGRALLNDDFNAAQLLVKQLGS